LEKAAPAPLACVKSPNSDASPRVDIVIKLRVLTSPGEVAPPKTALVMHQNLVI